MRGSRGVSRRAGLGFRDGRDAGGRRRVLHLLKRAQRTAPTPTDRQRGDGMPTLIANPTRIEAAGTKPKIIEEFVGRVNTRTEGASVAHMRSPAGWVEPGQTPEFDEYSIVLQGVLRVTHKGGTMDVK